MARDNHEAQHKYLYRAASLFHQLFHRRCKHGRNQRLQDLRDLILLYRSGSSKPLH